MNIEWNEDAFRELCFILKKELGAVPIDRHPDIILNELLRIAVEREGRLAGKLRQREAARIVEWINVELKKRYGKYVNICQYRVRNGNLHFIPNIECVFKTSGGYIYKTVLKKFKYVFFTSHSISRFEERVPTDFLNELSKNIGSGTTSLDLLSFIFNDGIDSGVEYAYELGPDKCLYVNIRFGVLVFNRYGNVFVAKTFLTPEMIPIESLKWFATDLDAVGIDDSFEKWIENFYPIQGPCFYKLGV